MNESLTPGDPGLLGATVQADGINFAVYSRDAEQIDLCLFNEEGTQQTARLPLPARDGHVWHGFLPNAKDGLVYGLRAHGPYTPDQGLRFNAQKLLLDPYARELTGTFQWHDAHYGYDTTSPDKDLSFSTLDNAPYMYKAVARDLAAFDTNALRSPSGWAGTAIYEAHVRGVTMTLPGLSDAERGTLAGLSSDQALAHIKAIGMTAIQLMPSHTFIHDHRLEKIGLRNYWGYNSLSYFTLMPSYVGPMGQVALKHFVEQAHDHGLEVLLDVVYNHTCETDQMGPTLCYRGLDNRAYYRLQSDSPRYYDDVTACGSTFNFEEDVVRQLTIDSLAYYHETFAVDGFRFDLAPAHGVDDRGRFSSTAPFFDALRAQPWSRDVKLIAEPWMPAPNGMCAGDFPFDWAEWNGGPKEKIRRYWSSGEGRAADIVDYMSGSPHVFATTERGPWASVNYASCHDGSILADALRFKQKHNHANGEDNRDGPDEDCRQNFGHEGFSPDPALEALRDRHHRNVIATVYLSLGSLMVLHGDEIGRTQKGNNNSYAQDNDISWMDWESLSNGRASDILTFTKTLAAIRKRTPLLQQTDYPLPGSDDGYHWFTPDGQALMSAADGYSGGAAMVTLRSSANHCLLILLNNEKQDTRFTLPSTPDEAPWTLAADTAAPTLSGGHKVQGATEHDLADQRLQIWEWTRA